MKTEVLFKRLKVIMEESGPRKIRWMTYQNHAGSPVKLGTSPMKSKKNLTRFTYETAAFEGWRLHQPRQLVVHPLLPGQEARWSQAVAGGR